MFGLGIKILLASVSFTMAITTVGRNVGEQPNYVADVKLVYAKNISDATSKLVDDYELADTTPLYKYGEGSSNPENTYLAIKKTNDVNDAITDIRAMNMVGGWSVNSYDEVLKNQSQEIEKLVAFIKPAIADFKNKYDKGIKKAEEGKENGVSFASIILNSLYFDDIIDSKTGKPITIRDLFLQFGETGGLCTDGNLKTIFMQGNSKAVFTIETALMYATVALEDESEKKEDDTHFYLKKFADYQTIQDCRDIDPSSITEEDVDMMIESIYELKETLNIFVKSGFASKLPKGDHPSASELQKFTDDLTSYLGCLSMSDALSFQNSMELYATLDGYFFMELDPMFGEGSLADFILEFNDNDDDFEVEVIYPFIVSMTEAQKHCYSLAGFDNFLTAINNENKEATLSDGTVVPYLNVLVNEYKDSIKDKEGNYYTTSIFAGVDRRIFKAEGIALTSAAMREQNAKNDYDWFKTDESAEKILEHIAKGCFAISLCGLGLCALTYGGCAFVSLCRLGIKQGHVGYSFRYVFSQGTFSQGIKFWAELDINPYQIKWAKEDPRLFRKVYGRNTPEYEVIRMCRRLNKVMNALKGIATVAGVIMGIAMIVDFARKIVELVTESKINYEPIPEIMVDERLVNDQAVYSYYYNVRNIADNKVADVTKASYHGHSQWVSLFYTKDKSFGTAIKADSIEVLNSVEAAEDEAGVRKFGENGLYNVTKYTSKSNPKISIITYEEIDTISTEKEAAIRNIVKYAATLFEKNICETPNIIKTYTQKIKDATSLAEINQYNKEALDALNRDKIENYDYVFPVMEQINNLGDITLPDKQQVQAAREAYDKLSSVHQQYVENYDVLVSAELTIYSLELEQDKITALKKVKEYMQQQTNLGSDEEKEKIFSECQEIIMTASTKEELIAAVQIAFDKVNAKVAEIESQAASTFGKGNLGLLFIGLISGIAISAIGVWLVLRLLKKGKEKEDSKPEDNN